MTASIGDLPRSPTPDDVLRRVEALAGIGVSTVIVGPIGEDPAGWLESTFGPLMDDLRAIEIKTL